MDKRVCPETGKTMTRGTRQVTVIYKELSEVIELNGWYAEDVESGLHSEMDLKVMDRALTRLKARHAELLEPDEIRKIRKSLKLTQQAAGNIIGGGPKAFQKYESGDLLPSKAISNLLKVLSKIPNAIEVLRKPIY